MGRRARWKQILDTAKDEALLAVAVYNDPREPRGLEAFLVHMHIAWQNLCHAQFHRDHIVYHHREANGRYVKIDGERKAWELSECIKKMRPAGDPVRENLELTIRLRNKIEHRYTSKDEILRLATAGYCQSLVLNFERELVDKFGPTQSLASNLRLPIFLATFIESAMEQARRVSKELPDAVRGLLTDHAADLDPEVVNDPRFEFRVNLIPKTGPKAASDMAIQFVRLEDLTHEQREAIEQLNMVIVREQLRPVSNLGMLKPSQVAKKVEEVIPFRFQTNNVTEAWKKLRVRPPTGDPHPERTIDKYCCYDEPHGDYIYTDAFVKKLIRESRTAERYAAFFGREPKPKPSKSRSAA